MKHDLFERKKHFTLLTWFIICVPEIEHNDKEVVDLVVDQELAMSYLT